MVIDSYEQSNLRKLLNLQNNTYSNFKKEEATEYRRAEEFNNVGKICLKFFLLQFHKNTWVDIKSVDF